TTEADKELTIAQSLSPAHDYSNDHFAVLQRTGRTLERQRQELEEKTPNNPFVLMIMAKNYGIAGRFKESVEMWERCLTRMGGPILPTFSARLRQRVARDSRWKNGCEQWKGTQDRTTICPLVWRPSPTAA